MTSGCQSAQARGTMGQATRAMQPRAACRGTTHHPLMTRATRRRHHRHLVMCTVVQTLPRETGVVAAAAAMHPLPSPVAGGVVAVAVAAVAAASGPASSSIRVHSPGDAAAWEAGPSSPCDASRAAAHTRPWPWAGRLVPSSSASACTPAVTSLNRLQTPTHKRARLT